MAGARLYLGGKNSSNEPEVAWLDPITKAKTDLPAIGGTGEIRALEVISEDDIWAGFYYQNSGSNYPKWAHWDGATWTIYEFTGSSPFFQQYTVIDIYAVSSNEVYSTTRGPGNRYYIMKWDGASWAVHASAGGIFAFTYWTTIMPGATANDIWLSDINKSGQQVAHWDGATWDEYGTIGTLFVNVSGMRTYKGEIYCASYDSKAYTRTAPSTWTAKPGFNVPNAFDPRYGDCFFHDTEEDILWAGAWQTIGVNIPGVAKWDGTTMTFELNGIPGGASAWNDVAGFSVGHGNDAQLWFAILSSVGYRESNGTWGKVDFPGFTYYTLQALGSFVPIPSLPPFMGFGQQFGGPNYGTEQFGTEFLYDPLYVANQDPTPGTVDIALTKVLEFDLLEGDLPIVLEDVEIYVEGALAYSGATDTFSAPYNGPSSARTPIVGPPAGHHFDINKSSSWSEGSTVVVRAVGADTGSPIDQIWYLYILNPGPLVIPISPTAGETAVNPFSNIEMQIQDGGGSVLSSLRVYIRQGSGDWELAYDGSVPEFKPGWDGPASALTGPDTNRTLVIDSTTSLAPGSVIQVWVFAEDPAGEQARLS